MSEYAEREAPDLEPYYSRHVSAMTGEGLHSKSAIAAELAYRDKRTVDLEKQLAERDAALARCVEAANAMLEAWDSKSPLAWQPERQYDFLKRLRESVATIPAYAQATAKVQQWQPIETAPKGKKILAAYKNELGNWRRIVARYYLPGTLEAGDDDEEADENGYSQEGWFEETETHDFLMRCAPSHWMPLPEPPTEAIREEKEGK